MIKYCHQDYFYISSKTEVSILSNFPYLLEQFYAASQIPVHVYRMYDHKSVMRLGEFTTCDPLQADTIKDSLQSSAILHRTEEKAEHEHILLLYDSEVICTALFTDAIENVIVLGPVCFSFDTYAVSLFYAQKHDLPEDFVLPMITRTRFEAMASLLYFSLNGEPADLRAAGQQLPADLPQESESRYEVESYVMDRVENEKIRHSYVLELQKMKQIENGDVEGILKEITPEAFQKGIELVGEMSKLPRKQWEYTVVSSLTKSAEAAIRGGVTYEKAYDLSDTLIQRLSRCESLNQIMNLQGEIRLQFASLVREEKQRKSQVSKVEQAKEYMTLHLNKAFTLDEMAASVGISKYYLLRKFKEAEGMTPQEYLRKMRIQTACDMLRYSEFSISYIAEYLCFSSQSHFGSVFRKQTGMTPMEYRNQA